MTTHDPEKTDPRRRPAKVPERPADDTEREPAKHQGATEEDVAPVTPPRGPLPSQASPVS